MSRKHRRMNRRKRNGFIVKGITQRHWWDRYDKDGVNNSRHLIKRDIKHHLKAWGIE